jgi:hypothetical protein
VESIRLADHQLKINRKSYNEIQDHRKYYEIRINDRNYKEGDWLILYDYDKITGYSGRVTAVEVISVTQSILLPSMDWVIMSIGLPEEAADEYNEIALKQKGIV